MTATSGDWLRRAVPATMIALTMGLGACSGSDSEPTDPKASATTAEPTADQAAADQAAVEKLATAIWAVRQQVYNSGEATKAIFQDIYSTAAIESELGKVRQYQGQKILRTGAPEITDVEAAVTGDTGEILLCLNEDDWNAEEDGTPIDTPARGANPWGATVQRDGDRWVFVDEIPTADIGARKSC
ncbi:MAG: hypothetical protein ABWX74_18280 [Aeromicrobium sp.]